MSRARAILQSQFAYNIGARCINRDWFALPMDQVWEIFCEELSGVVVRHKLDVHSFVLMSNHFHLIASTPEANISQCMHQFMGRTSRRLTCAGNRINETFAGRHFKCILQHRSYFLNAYKYNYRNPVHAGVCELVEDYRFSSLQWLINKSEPRVPLIKDTTFIENPKEVLKWLNTPPRPELLESVRYGFKHQFFKAKKDPITNKPMISEDETL